MPTMKRTPGRRKSLGGGRLSMGPLTPINLNNDLEEKRARRRSRARRKSHKFTPFKNTPGKTPGKHGLTNEEIASQIAGTIKLHTQNKINEKNAFELPLSSLLQESRGKFERASVVLEAGTIIYSKRVDSTLTSTCVVRENLFRNKKSGRHGVSDNGVSEVGEDGTKKRPRRKTVSSTLEKNKANISTPIAGGAVIDPIFHWMKHSLGEISGIKGTLLCNLVVQGGCRLMIGSAASHHVNEELSQPFSENVEKDVVPVDNTPADFDDDNTTKSLIEKTKIPKKMTNLSVAKMVQVTSLRTSLCTSLCVCFI